MTVSTKAKGLKIVQLTAENFKKLHAVQLDITPEGQLVQITGGNGQGKTSVLDLIWFLLKGQKALPSAKQSVITNGQESMRCSLKVRGENMGFTVTRSLNRNNGIPTLSIDMLTGERLKIKPQDFLDGIFGALTFDPLEFVHMEPKEQVAELQRASNTNIDFKEIEAANLTDYKARHLLNQEVSRLYGKLANMSVIAGLPKEKLDEDAVLQKLNKAGELNRKAQEVFAAKQELGAAAARIGVEHTNLLGHIERKNQEIARLRELLKAAELEAKQMEAEAKKIKARFDKAEAEFKSAPAGEPVDVAALTMELQSVQGTNRAIDVRAEWEIVKAEHDAKRAESDQLTRQMDARNAQVTQAVLNAKIPVEGLTFDATKIEYKGVLLENLGEAEQIRIATLIGMAANPHLRVICIRHGEALDDKSLKIMAQLAVEHDFQIWMSRVDSSGKVGIVIEEGRVAKINREAVNA